MRIIFGAFMIISVVVSCNDLASQEGKSKILDWALSSSQKIETLEITERQEDLSLLKNIVGKAEVLCLGESRHDIHEQFKLKHRFIKYLVEELNFTTFVLEASLPYSNRINNFVLNGEGNIDEIMSNMPGWFLWDTREMKNILKWLYEYNQGQEMGDKVNFYGIDIVAPNNGLEQIFSYIQNVDEPYFELIKRKNFGRSIIEDNQWQITQQHYSELSEEEKQILMNSYNGLFEHIMGNKEDYISRSSEDEFDWILKLSYAAKEANRMFSEEDKLKMGLIRENAMANITFWIKERNNKLILWAHNVHIGKSEFTMSVMPENIVKGMGYILNQKLGDNMVSIGASFNEGVFRDENRIFKPADPNTIDGTLAKLKMKYFILDLGKDANSIEVEKWLNTDKILRAQGFQMTCVPKKSFDAIFFTNTISKVNYNKVTLEKLKN